MITCACDLNLQYSSGMLSDAETLMPFYAASNGPLNITPPYSLKEAIHQQLVPLQDDT